MVSKKLSTRMVSKVSSAATPATASSTQTTNKSSILRSAFSPSRFQLSLFASVIQGLDAQHLRIHDFTTGKLRCEHAVNPKASISCLDWGYYSSKHKDQYDQQPKKKRKRSDQANGSNRDAVVVAFGTSDSDIQLFSPSEAKIVGVLKGVHTQGVTDFKFTDYGESSEGWSSGGDGKLVQWNIRKGTSIRTLPLPASFATTLLPLTSSLLCASHTVYMIDPTAPENPSSFPASTNFVHSIVASAARNERGLAAFLSAAESERVINVFNTGSSSDAGRMCGSLLLEHDAESVSYFVEDLGKGAFQEIIAVVNKEGTVEIFPSPFEFGGSSGPVESISLKSQRKSMTRKAVATVRFTRADKSNTTIPVISASFQDDYLWVAWTEGGVDLVFDELQWRDEHTSGTILMGRKEVVKPKGGGVVGAEAKNGVKDMGKVHVDESHAVVANGGDVEEAQKSIEETEVIDISSGEDEDSQSDSDEVQELSSPSKSLINGDTHSDTIMQDPDDSAGEAGDTEEIGEPSFGDLIRANAPEMIDVTAAFGDPSQPVLAPSNDTSLQLPSGMSLGTVLTQALRTNDVNLLETCFHVRDLGMVRATIERLNSTLAIALLQKLAERLHSRPGRAGSLMVWIQWTLVAHGGYLASQPEMVKRLTSLHRVVNERASSLQSLLSLKGKLDMLEAQMNLRKSMQIRSGNDLTADEDDEDAVIYVEGQEESSSEDEADNELRSMGSKHAQRSGEHEIPDGMELGGSSDGEDEEDEMPTTMEGLIPDSEDELSESDAEGLIDNEASDTEDDTASQASDDVDHESIDSMEEDDESEPEEPPSSKRLTNAKLSNGVASTKER